MATWFHCKVIDTTAVVIKKVTVDPVDVPIAQATFVTGEITNPIRLSQSVFLFKYTGTQSNGSVNGVITTLDDEVMSIQGEFALSTDPIFASLAELGIFPTVTTINDTLTDLGDEFPVNENIYIHIDFQVTAIRTDGPDEYFRIGIYYDFYRDNGGSLTLHESTEYDKVGGLQADLVVSGNAIQAEVLGNAAEDWAWTLTKYDITQVPIPADT